MGEEKEFNSSRTPWDDSKNIKQDRQLEEALQSVVKKLGSLHSQLNEDEKKIFEDIVRSAAMHTSVVGAAEKGETVAYKPVSVHISPEMRATISQLPKTLNIAEDRA